MAGWAAYFPWKNIIFLISATWEDLLLIKAFNLSIHSFKVVWKPHRWTFSEECSQLCFGRGAIHNFPSVHLILEIKGWHFQCSACAHYCCNFIALISTLLFFFTDSFPWKPQDFRLWCCSLGFRPRDIVWIWQVFQPPREWVTRVRTLVIIHLSFQKCWQIFILPFQYFQKFRVSLEKSYENLSHKSAV